MNLYRSLGISLLGTLLIELLIALLCKKRGRTLVVVMLANLLTNPPLVLIWQLGGRPFWVLLPLEGAAVFLEGFCYLHCCRQIRAPYCFSLCCNAISFGIGLFMNGGSL